MSARDAAPARAEAPPLGLRARELAARPRPDGGELEVYEKRGRSRRLERGPVGEVASQSVEAGWAMRGGGARGSWFLAGSGLVPERPPAPEATPQPLRLPEPSPIPSWTAPPALEAPLASEPEARALLDAVARELARELPGARLVAARLDEGASESALVSSRGVEARVRARSAALRVEARRGAVRVEAEQLARTVSGFEPRAVARRLADRLSALDAPAAAPGGVARLLVGGAIGARLLEAYAPRLVGAGAAARRDEGRIGGESVRIVDDAARPEGLLGAPWDGEGTPTRSVTLVEAGELVTPLLAWWECADRALAAGCVRRAGWRDLPRPGPTELVLSGEATRPLGALLDELGTGAYLIAPEGGVRLEGDGERFTLSVSGYRVERGAAARPLGPVRLCGSLEDWLAGIRALARDVVQVAGTAIYGAPSALVEGLELRERS